MESVDGVVGQEGRPPVEAVRAYLGLGTNLGDRAAHLEEAVRRLGELGSVAERSDVMETAPWGYADQPDFLNMVVALDTTLSPMELLSAVKRIEREMGRVPTIRYGPRTIDIDLLVYGDATVEIPELTVPHPRMHERAFVMEPLAQIAPDLAARIRARGEEDRTRHKEDPHADVSL
jgi:2-amino-4-hydroxy-6-hydroxymethyldihydropteridine diphosphokinase